MRHLLPNSNAFFRTPHPVAAASAVGAFAVALVVWRVARRKRPDADAVERARRERLASLGRLTDGNLVDTATFDGRYLAEATGLDASPRMLLYRYRVAGVGYEAVQDVSGIEGLARDIRVDLPIQVRYDQENPADSIVVAEEWSGLRYGRGEL